MHFEELWEKCEQLHQEANQKGQPTTNTLLEELMMKINLYKAIDAQGGEIAGEDRQKIKSRTLGEILLTLTHVSLIDGVDVFEALGVALQYRSVGFYQQKY